MAARNFVLMAAACSACVGTASHAASAATPSSNGLVLWLDSSDSSTVTTNASGGVTAWANKAAGTSAALAAGAGANVVYTGANDNLTSTAYNASAPTYIASTGTTNGAKVLNFNGNGYLDNLAFSTATPQNLTVFVLVAPTGYPTGGHYSSFLAFNQSQASNDYSSGLNIDQGDSVKTALSEISVEGAKAGGEFNLLNTSTPYSSTAFHTIELHDGSGAANQAALTFDGTAQGSRNVGSSTISLNDLYIGTRAYASGNDQSADHDLQGEVAAVLVYNTDLTGTDLTQTESYLAGFFTQPVPEPTTLALVALAVPVLGRRRRR